MPAFPCEGDRTAGLTIKVGTQRDQVANGLRAFCDQHFNCLRVTQAGAGSDGVCAALCPGFAKGLCHSGVMRVADASWERFGALARTPPSFAAVLTRWLLRRSNSWITVLVVIAWLLRRGFRALFKISKAVK